MEYRLSTSQKGTYLMEALVGALNKNAGKAKGELNEEKGEYVGNLYYDEDINRYKLKFSDTTVLIVDNDGTLKIPQILRAQKVLMAQSGKPDLLTSFGNEHQENLTTDVHAHYTAMLEPEKLFALGLKHNVNYHAYYMYALELELSEKQKEILISNIINISKKNPTQAELSEDEAKKILMKLDVNKGKPKRIEEILDTYGLKQSLCLDFQTLILDAPESKTKENIEKIIKSCSLSTEEKKRKI